MLRKYKVSSVWRRGQRKKGETQLPLNKFRNLKYTSKIWPRNTQQQIFFLKILWSDGKKVSLDEPDGWALVWITNRRRAAL